MSKSLHSREYAVFVRVLRGTRERLGVTQVELAERLSVTQVFVSKCERGERRLDIVELRRWCAALGVGFVELAEELQANLDTEPVSPAAAGLG